MVQNVLHSKQFRNMKQQNHTTFQQKAIRHNFCLVLSNFWVHLLMHTHAQSSVVRRNMCLEKMISKYSTRSFACSQREGALSLEITSQWQSQEVLRDKLLIETGPFFALCCHPRFIVENVLFFAKSSSSRSSLDGPITPVVMDPTHNTKAP